MLEAIQALQSSIEIVGRLKSLAKKVENAEFKMLLAELSGDLGNAKLEVANLKVELASLREENERLKEAAVIRSAGQPAVVDDVYSFPGQEGLFCTACYDVNRRQVRVKALAGAFTAFGKWECPSCKATYGGAF